MRGGATVLFVSGAVNQQGRGVDVDGAVGERSLRELQIRERRAEQIARGGVVDHLIEGAPGEPERGGGDGRAEDIERRHGNLEALAGAAEPVGQRHAAAGEANAPRADAAQ